MRTSIILLSSTLYLSAVVACATTTSKSNGCGKALPTQVTAGVSRNLTIQSGNLTRGYRIHVPSSYQTDVAVPLILSFHGRTKDGLEQEGLSQFSNSSYGFEGISVYPEGVPYTGSKERVQQWQGDPVAPTNISDINFTSDLIDHLLDRYCLDPKRVYASGKSNGGGLVTLLACDPVTSAKIAAFAPVSAARYLNGSTWTSPPACNPTKDRVEIPIMEFHGLLDDTIPYNSTVKYRSGYYFQTEGVAKFVDDWAKRDGYDPNANTTTTLCGSGSKQVTRYSWDDVVVHYKYANLKHDWPAPFANDDNDGKRLTCVDADATRIILDWFSTWSL